jgi:hypothetical protein
MPHGYEQLAVERLRSALHDFVGYQANVQTPAAMPPIANRTASS